MEPPPQDLLKESEDIGIEGLQEPCGLSWHQQGEEALSMECAEHILVEVRVCSIEGEDERRVWPSTSAGGPQDPNHLHHVLVGGPRRVPLHQKHQRRRCFEKLLELALAEACLSAADDELRELRLEGRVICHESHVREVCTLLPSACTEARRPSRRMAADSTEDHSLQW